MSDVWSEGYVTGVGYTYGYYRETSPVYQRFCLLLRGLVCNDVDETTAHCELGFGQGYPSPSTRPRIQRGSSAPTSIRRTPRMPRPGEPFRRSASHPR